MKLSLVLMCLLGCCTNVFAQKALYVKPLLGAQWTLSSADHSMGDRNVFGASKGIFTNNIGVLLELEMNEKWAVVSGWNPGNIGWGYSLKMPDELTKNPAKIGSFGQRTTATQIHRFPVLMKYHFAKSGNVSDEINGKKVGLKVYAQTGLSLDFLPDNRNEEETNIGAGRNVADSYGDSIMYFERKAVLNQWNVSLLAGIGTQIYLKGKPRLDVTLFYSHGLREMVRQDVTYQLNSYKGSGRISSRGSVIGATLAYPIRLKTFQPKSV